MKRLNVKLLVILCVAVVFLVVGVWALHRFQTARNSGMFLDLAKQAIEEKDYLLAAQNFHRYLHHDPDNREANEGFAMALTDHAESPGSTQQDKVTAYSALEQVLRKFDDLVEVRKRLAEFAVKINRADVAVAQYEELVKKEATDTADNRVLLGKAYELTEDLEKAGSTYDSLIEKHPADIRGYVLKARLLRAKLNKPEEADALIDQMVEANQDLPRAYLERARYLNEIKFRDAAAEDLAKALELAPNDLDVLTFAVEFANSGRDFATARTHLTHAIEQFPDNADLVRRMAHIDWFEGKREDAVAKLKEAWKKDPESRELLVQLCDFQIDSGDIAGARATFEELQKLPGINNDFLELPLSRILLAEGKFNEAAQRLERIRPLMARNAYYAVQIDLLLAECYRSMGQPDKQMGCYERALLADPLSVPARRGRAVLLMASGREEESLAEWKQLTATLPEARAIVLKLEMNRRRALPADQQDFGDIEKLLAEWKGDDKGSSNTMVGLLEADVLASQGKFAEARAAAESARKANPQQPQPWMYLVSLLLREHPDDFAGALALIDDAEKEIPNSIELQMLRIDVLTRQGGEPALAALAAQEAAAGKLEEKAQLAVWQKLGGAYYKLGDRKTASKLWNQVIDRDPRNAPLLLALFALSQESDDEAGMQAAIDRIAQILGENSAEFDYTQAARIASRIRSKKNEPGSMDDARRILGQALEKRPRWSALRTLAGDIEALDGNSEAAIDQYQQAVDLGDQSPGVLRRLIQLLAGSGRWEEANERLTRLEQFDALTPEMQKVRIIVRQQLGQVNLEEASAALAGSSSPQDLIWLGQLYQREKKHAEAETTLRQAVTLDETNPSAWIALVSVLAAAGKMEDAETAIQQGQAKVAAKDTSLMSARAYELMGNPTKALAAYQEALAASPADLTLLRQLTEFLLRQGRTDEATPSLEKMIALAAEASAKDQIHIVWARRQLARVLSISGGYNQLVQALELIQANAQGDSLSLEDQMLKAALLARAPDRKSRDEAVAIYESAAPGTLRPVDRFQLAKLYEQLGRWDRSREEMLALMAAEPNNMSYQGWFVQMLLKHDELGEALPRIEKLEQETAQSLVTIELRARAMIRQGQIEQAVSLLRRAVPNPLPPQQRNLLSAMGALMVEMAQQAEPGDQPRLYQAAEQFYRDFVAATPDSNWVLAAYLAQHGNVNEALSMCEELLGTQPQTAVDVAMTALRSQRASIEAQQFEKVSHWIDQLGDRVTPLRRLFLQADLAETRGQYGEAEKLYRQILEQPNLAEAESITALNNLAFLVAAGGGAGQEALEMIQRAIDLGGPMSELLDTRAMAYLSVGDSQRAIEDLQEAIAMAPNGLKYFHLALAHQKANDQEAATKAYQESKRLGLSDGEIPPIEQSSYRRLIESLN